MSLETTILIVDDHRELLSSLQLTCELAGYRSVTTRDGAEALAILQSQPVDLIISDIAMPGMNGYQLYERIRANPDWLMIPFIFLTARALDSDVRFGKELGVDDYLTKPIQPEDLLAAVRGRLQRARQLRGGAGSQAEETDRSRRYGRLTIDAERHRAWLGGQQLELAAREFKALDYLAQRAERVVSSCELIELTHGLRTNHADAGGLVRPLIRGIRRRLGYGVGEMGCIENVRGVGYRLVLAKLAE